MTDKQSIRDRKDTRQRNQTEILASYRPIATSEGFLSSALVSSGLTLQYNKQSGT